MEQTLHVRGQGRSELSATKRELLEKRLRGAVKVSSATPSSLKRRLESGPAPLSFIQQQLWFIHELEPSSPAYNVPAVLWMHGPLHAEALERALNRTLERQEALRTVFPSRDDGPVQVVEPFQPRNLPLVDLQEFPQADRKSRAEQFVRREAHKPFDLKRGPLFRATLLRLSDLEHVLCLVIHHIVTDGWSLGIIFHDLEAYYTAETMQTDVALPELPIRFTDFAVWQTQADANGAFASDIDFWRQRLEGAPSSIDLPLDHVRPSKPSSKGGADTLVLPCSFADSMRTFSHVNGTTSFMLLLTALAILLNKWTSQSDLVLGTVVAGRTRKEIENLVGCFMNLLPLRARFADVATGSDLLRQVRSTVLEAYAHQDCPFEKVVAALNPTRQLAGNPLYNVALLLQNFPGGVFQSGGLRSDFLPVTTDAALLDLRFVAAEIDSTVAIQCEYNSELFEAETINQLLASYRLILETLIGYPELPLTDYRLAPELIQQATAARSRLIKQTIAAVGTFTVEPLEDVLSFWMEKLEVPTQLRFAPYNQVFQQLLDPTSLVRTNERGLNLVLLRLEDLDHAEAESTLENHVDELIGTFLKVSGQLAAPCLICVCPPSKAALGLPGNSDRFARLETRICQKLGALPNAHVVTGSQILDLYPVPEYDDPTSERLGHVPYTTAFFHSLGTYIARHFHALVRPPRKVIVLDCDQTLWSGVCGEDGLSGIRCDAPRKALQEFMRRQHDDGMLLAVCSKNNESDVADVFDRCTDMVLRRTHFAAWRVNWDAKSANLRSLAAELNVGLDSFVFVDDNPVECAEVEANYPEVLTLQVPADPEEIPKWLKHLWVFDRLSVTAEDRKRTAMYHQNRLREQLMAESTSMADFIAGLGLQIQIEPATPEQLPRLAQLTERTNQFNCTTIRRTEAELTRLAHDPSYGLLSVSVADRFGNYGLVGLTIYRSGTEAIVVDTFLLSCRVLGKGVEHRLLANLGEIAQTANLDRVDVPFRPTAKNKPAADFLNNVGGPFRHGTGVHTVFHFPADVACQIAFEPAEHPVRPSESVPVRVAQDGSPGRRFRQFNWIAQNASDLQKITALVSDHRTPSLQGGRRSGGREPRTPLERDLLQIWRELLRRPDAAINDDFFALGGTSLLAVRLCAQIEKTLSQVVPLATLFRAPTVEQLARTLDRSHARNGRSSLVAIQHKGSKPPLVLVHGAGGGILWGYANMAALLGHDQPVYAFEPRPVSSDQALTVEAMARQYINDLRNLQPKGPYYLGGYCFGGYVAYEMARQLEMEGEQIALLALLDSAAPNGSYEQVPWWRPGYYPRFVRNSYYWLADFFSHDASERAAFVSRKCAVAKRRLARVFHRSRKSGEGIALDEYIEVKEFPAHELDLWKAHLSAGANYRPGPYGGPVVLLRTRGQPVLCSLDPQYGWGELAQGGVEIRLIPGAHEKIFVEPDVRGLAIELQKVLACARQRLGATQSVEAAHRCVPSSN